jgi:ribosome biogenesis GTPase
LGFIDRFLVTLEAFRIPGVIIFNKTDILSEEELEALNFLQFIYEKKVGYQFLKTSFLHNALSPEIASILKGKITMLSGHSGAGKSTMVNLLLPEADQKTAEISGFANKGVHTTTFAEMFFLDETTAIIDTPGIKELGLSEIEPEELAHYFPEMRAFLGECRFHNCLHNGEPGCAIQDALENGVIVEERYNSYLSMLQPDDNRR